MPDWRTSNRGEKKFISKGPGTRKGAVTLGSSLSPDALRSRLNSFIDHQRKLVGYLSVGNVRLIQVGALVPDTIKARATALADQVIQRSLASNDLLVPCGEDGFVILFHKTTAEIADQKTREIGDELAGLFGDRKDLKGLTTQSFSYDLSRYLDAKWIGTLEDLKRVVQQAYGDHARDVRAQVRRAEDTDTVRFAPVISNTKRLLVGYDVRLYLNQGATGRSSVPFSGQKTAAEKAEVAALTIERLAFRLERMSEPLANVLLFPPVSLKFSPTGSIGRISRRSFCSACSSAAAYHAQSRSL